MWVCASFPGKPYSSVEGRKPFAGKSPRRRCGFAPHTRESLILPSRGANFLPGKGAGGRVSLRPIPRKALFFRRGAQTFCREEAPAAVGVFASYPGKPYSSVERRKPFTWKRRRRSRGFAPHTRESLILPLRGANHSPGKGAGGRGGLRLIPGKPYSSVEGRKLFAGKRRRRLWGFAPRTPESLVPPSRGANQLPGRGAGGCEGLRLGAGSLRLTPGKALFHR